MPAETETRSMEDRKQGQGDFNFPRPVKFCLARGIVWLFHRAGSFTGQLVSFLSSVLESSTPVALFRFPTQTEYRNAAQNPDT